MIFDYFCAMEFKSGFINIIGHPNVGKSTLMNALVGERLSIITSKPQTTRQRIMGIVNGEHWQMVFSDTPGIIDRPAYTLQEHMNAFVAQALEDADILIILTDPFDRFDPQIPVFTAITALDIPGLVVINKSDLFKDQEHADLIRNQWSERLPGKEILTVSALQKAGLDGLQSRLLELLPEGPLYYPTDQLTDRNVRFYAAEIIREKILELYKQEVPYSCQVEVEYYQEGEDLDRISAAIFVNRKSQKPILIGREGQAIKKLGIAAREAIESFIDKKVYLELVVKIKEDWRDNPHTLENFGYRY